LGATAQRLACDTALLGAIVDKHGKVFHNSRNKINKPRSQAGASKRLLRLLVERPGIVSQQSDLPGNAAGNGGT
jgi:hypothetical protein